MVWEHFSSLYPLVWQVYSLPSNLFFGDSIISSATGVQQGDPLGPALFSLALFSHPLICDLSTFGILMMVLLAVLRSQLLRIFSAGP